MPVPKQGDMTGLVPCNDNARQRLVDILLEASRETTESQESNYVARTFPSILLDVARLLIEQATNSARNPANPPEVIIQSQLKPYHMFCLLLGKCPQLTGLMYSYFESSSFQPLPENSFQFNTDEKKISYTHPGFTDELVKEILTCYFKYLSFNPRWFSAIWNWSELGRFITLHTNQDIRYLAALSLSVITQPTRSQHMAFMQDIFGLEDSQTLVELQVKYRRIFENTFKPCIEPKKDLGVQFAMGVGLSTTGYSYCLESLTKVSNILLMKRDVSLDKQAETVQAQCEKITSQYIPVASVNDTISKIAYSLSINKPCLLRGTCGSGKTSLLDYVAAQTLRVNPPDYIKVQIGDQIDSKLLIGSYVSTKMPGQFEWQPGPLTRAMMYGSWIVFEDIDSAPLDMAQVIHSVIENGNLSCVSCCPIKLDSPHPDFRILFTQRTRIYNGSDSLKLGFGFVERLCDIVDLPELCDDDLQQIIDERYKFGLLSSTILKLYRSAEASMKESSINRATRMMSFRDLFKFCDRVSRRNLQSSSGKFSTSEIEALYLDAVDCFLRSLPRNDMERAGEILGQILNLPPNEVQRLVFQRKPNLREESEAFIIGRAKLEIGERNYTAAPRSLSTLAYTKQSLQLMECISLSIKCREPVLLVGETGVGKTSIIQFLANMMKTDLVVVNLSQQSDSSDLLGGYKPADLREIITPINDQFDKLFKKTFEAKSNETFLRHVTTCFSLANSKPQWNLYLKLVCKICSKALGVKLTKPLCKTIFDGWSKLHDEARRLSKRISAEKESAPMALAFSEGTLLRAVKNGQWILLDEINLAEPDILQCLLLVLDSIKKPHVYLNNLNEGEEITQIHPNFRLFACMNPSTDIGKRDLAPGTRGRFSEFFVDDITDNFELRLIVEAYVKPFLSNRQIENIVKFYQEARARKDTLSDISGNSPVYSLRTLCRALSISSYNVCGNREKSLFESLRITFLQQLNEASILQVMKLIEQTVFDAASVACLMDTNVPKPKDDEYKYVDVQGFWLRKSSEEQGKIVDDYILTKSVTRNLQSLSRIISLSQRRLPILIQGNTSVGKTSLIKYLAAITGNRCYRINNHEHTDLQDYVGRYVLKEDGELVFQEGLLVRAMKKGYWIILDELNLAPCELLEALNRVLDDNRELFIPETRKSVRAHTKFVLFATQNPPEEYAGRKLLSRAFRNRFIELHFDEIPTNELEVILEKKCEMAPQHAKKIVAVMKELQLLRRESGCFNGKNGFMTLRDLFRWGERYARSKKEIQSKFFDWDAHVASEGLILLEGRVRTVNEADTVKSIIEKVFKRKLDRDEIYGEIKYEASGFLPQFKHIHFSKEFQRLYVQLSRALKYQEPVLLCGQTGCGKTTACQLYSALNRLDLITYNCHLNTESADFVGGVRPTRIEESSQVKQTFPWVDGPLIDAMKTGSMFLMDEISLADDAVLERINSVIEPDRSICLIEKEGEEVFAKESFRFVATMNPGGDYGKKELSPALRNRFTEIYCHNTSDFDQIKKIVEGSLSGYLLKPSVAPKLLNVLYKFLCEYYKGYDLISIRDLLSWTQFLNKTLQVSQIRPLSIQESIINGASLVYFDQFGTCGHKAAAPGLDVNERKSILKRNLKKLVESQFGLEPVYSQALPSCYQLKQDVVTFKKFCVPKGQLPIYESVLKEFVIDAHTVKKNILKIVRAMQLDRPILLEGDPGVGKTSVVSALAKLTGHKLIRVNLSEQTDISDLFGSDLPDTSVDNDSPAFCWHDGPMLQAIRNSHWILLDEMNLASQSVLEGLNACFDHRGEIFIPELNKRITVDKTSTRIFACQNPYSQGAARKGLPQSFLNRFTSIYVEPHSPDDICAIVNNLYPYLPADLITKMVEFNTGVSAMHQYSGFEFNIRDILHLCDLMTRYVRETNLKDSNLYRPDRFVQFVYLDRMRTAFDKAEISDLFEKIFGLPVYEPPYRDIKLGEHSFITARSILPRKIRPAPHLADLYILKYQMPHLESIAKAIEFNKMPILVGETGVGKRSMVRIIAGLTGNNLRIIGANSEMDTTELLGSFEQKSLQRDIVELVEEAKKCVNSMINSISQKQYASTWSQFFNHIWATLYATSIRDLSLSKSEMIDAYRIQLNQMKELIEKIQPLSYNNEEFRCKELLSKIKKLMKKSLYDSESMCSSGNFEWIDSILVKSIKEGSWLMVENANLMNPATLDRLNSLVETKGSLSLNEKGSSDHDGIETLVPHSEFRLILTMNPEHGELSRAMRNRGVEIFIETRFYFEDFLMLLNLNGFEPEESKACMTYCVMQTSCDAHKKITGEDPADGGSLLAYFALNYISTLTNQVRRGKDIDQILADLLISYYQQKGFSEDCCDENIREYVQQQMSEYRRTYVVEKKDERYKWLHLRHDLVTMTGGDAEPAMVERDNRVFYDDFSINHLLKPHELVERTEIVSSCTQVKIFLELSTHGDFDYRKAFIRETFSDYPNMMTIVNRHLDLLQREHLPLLNCLLPKVDLTPPSEISVDSRNTPDLHYYLQCLDHSGAIKREGLQNRWLLSLHRMMLLMIVELIDEYSQTPGSVSLLSLSERVRAGNMMKEDLIRPVAEIAYDLYDLLNGIVLVVSNRCFDDANVYKMLPRFFWISYFICKLKRCYLKPELIAVCNQIPMLWALTYQKVIVPIIEDCGLADSSYKNKKFSHRIQHICDFLDMTASKPSHIEKAYYSKVLNLYAAPTKVCGNTSREVDRFFGTLIGRYTTRSQALSLGSDNADTLAASYNAWSNSDYMEAFYSLEDKLLYATELANKATTLSDYEQKALEEARIKNEADKVLIEKKNEYALHVERLRFSLGHSDQQDQFQKDQYKIRCLNINRRRNALDQFAPIWQLEFIQTALAKLSPSGINDPVSYIEQFRRLLKEINGIILSPSYYAAIMKFLTTLQDRDELRFSKETFTNGSSLVPQNFAKRLRQDLDMYTAYVSNHLIENVVLDHQIVGWTKLRVQTCDLPALAPIIPEYSSAISLVGSYCLDINHLKLNSFLNSNPQLNSILIYLWRNYVPIKLNLNKDLQDINLAEKLHHLRSKSNSPELLLDSQSCENPDSCACLEEYIRCRVPTYEDFVQTLKKKLFSEDLGTILKSINLIYFGYLNFIDYAPIFTLDPALRSREKLEVYKSELAHVKLDLYHRNTIFYWKTGENLQLNEIDSDDAVLYPFSIRVLVDRRVKLEKSINKLRREYTNRPKSDDGSLYYELRKDVESHVNRYTSYINSIVDDLLQYARAEPTRKSTKFNTLIARCRMFIKNIEKTILRFRSSYEVYADLVTNFLAGLCLVHQGLRCLYSKLEQRMQISNYVPTCDSIQEFMSDLMRVFSFSNFNQANLESVHSKLEFFPRLEKVCPADKINQTQSILLKTILLQLNHHIAITPSDIKKCIPIVRQIADLFHASWLQRKNYIEQQRKQKEELYRYKTSKTTLGAEISYENQEFLDICARFPTYDHIYQNYLTIPLTSADEENLATEQKMINLTRSVDLTMCIDICKAHYKFTKEAGRNLLGQVDSSKLEKMPTIDLSQVARLEADTLYTIIRHCIPALDRSFDSLSLECHLLQANQLSKILSIDKSQDTRVGSLKSSIEILDEEIFDIYHSANAREALRFQEFINEVDIRVNSLRDSPEKNYENDLTLNNIMKLTSKISSFLITDPMMKFVTGSHTLLAKIETWNQQSIPRDDKMLDEADQLIDLIKSWRSLEVHSWRNSLHNVKRKYIDSTLCDLWFHLYKAFSNPIDEVRNYLKSISPELTLSPENDFLYQGFASLIKDFFEEATLGDYQIRLDLVFSFTVQSRFASLYKQARPKNDTSTLEEEKNLTVDYEKLTTYVYNTYRQFQGLLESLKDIVEQEEKELAKELNTEVRIVAWQGRNLWEIKNNFRISHRKLNRVMNKYLEVLRRPLPYLRPPNSLVEDPLNNVDLGLDSERISVILAGIRILVDKVSTLECQLPGLKSFKKSPSIVNKMKEIYSSVYDSVTTRYVNNISVTEQLLTYNKETIENFHSHKVQEVVILPKDTKEIRAEKQKLCRQMYHSKKFALQSVFKGLQDLGSSYQRGLNMEGQLDLHILSVEPLRGMILSQSQLVLKAASRLVDDNLITACNEQYRKLIASNLYLLSQPSGEDLNSDQMNRVRGHTLDMVLDVIKHSKSAASIYRHLMDIQASATRLSELRKNSQPGNQTVIYHFATFRKTVSQFNELVGRACLTISKLEELITCFRALDCDLSSTGAASIKLSVEKAFLKERFLDIQEDYSLMTKQQLDHIQAHLLDVRQSIANVSTKLRDMLNYTLKNHLHSDDDLQQLKDLYGKFHNSFLQLLEFTYDEDEEGKDVPNSTTGTVIGSLRSILDEAESKIAPALRGPFRMADNGRALQLDQHPDVKELEIKFHKLLREIMLAFQNILDDETKFQRDSTPSSQLPQLSIAMKRKLKPFNYIDSSSIERLLRLDLVAKRIGSCFLKLNRQEISTDIKPIVAGLEPILFIYTQDVAAYLNIILSSLHLKLTMANQLIPFFTDLVLNGFGLPYKVQDDDATENAKSKSSEDNTGFGEGQGDTDVSKKLEYESQLDDLKKDTIKEKENGKEESVEAHNDGVEMSDDIDAKAEGPNENKDADSGHEDDDKDELNELDKEAGKVDHADDKLDENLWGAEDDESLDKDGEESGDDEDKDEDDTGTLEGAQTKSDDKTDKEGSKDDGKDEHRQDHQGTSTLSEKELTSADGDDNQEKIAEDIGDDETIENEAAQALKDSEMSETNEKDTQEETDMSIDLAHPSDDEDDRNGEQSQAEVEEGEIEASEEKLEEEFVLDSQTDDAVIDRQLEAALESDLDDSLVNPIEETLRNLTANAAQVQTDSSNQQMKGRKFGDNVVYDVFPEEDHDPLDVDEIPGAEETQKSDSEHAHPEESRLQERQQATDAPDDKRPEAGDQVRSSMEVDTNEGKSDKRMDHDHADEVDNEACKKRTFAEQNETDKSDLKRQRIEDAAEEAGSESRKPRSEKGPSESEEPEKKSERMRGSSNQSFKHIEQDTNSAVEVIDLVSSDDECLDKGLENVDQPGEAKLQPKDVASTLPRRTSDDESKTDDTSDDYHPASDNIIDLELPRTEDKEAAPHADIDENSAVSISSMESGELMMDSDYEESQNPSQGEFKSSRNLNTSYNTNLGLLKYISLPSGDNQDESEKKSDLMNATLMERIDNELNKLPASGHDSVDTDRLTNLWLDCTKRAGRLVQELCQHLQIVLQPTKMSKYRGDYKTGKRLNMRKIISYIASHYRKDKIWLRRTKPSKRTYNITLAVDNSSSMSENNCRQMTYQSLALLAKSLSLIEAGSMCLVSFGEQVKCIHGFDQPYMDAIGAQWLRELRFNESRTSYVQLLKHSCESFAKQAQANHLASQATGIKVSQLLVIISDGRNVSSEEDDIKLYLRQLKSMGVLTLFIIIDDLKRNSGNSIVDVKRCLGFGASITMVSYMEFFPFPFYVLLRQIETMPSILGDALRQWFELVS